MGMNFYSHCLLATLDDATLLSPYLQQRRSHNRHQKSLIEEFEKLFLHHGMSNLGNGVTEL